MIEEKATSIDKMQNIMSFLLTRFVGRVVAGETLSVDELSYMALKTRFKKILYEELLQAAYQQKEFTHIWNETEVLLFCKRWGIEIKDGVFSFPSLYDFTEHKQNLIRLRSFYFEYIAGLEYIIAASNFGDLIDCFYYVTPGEEMERPLKPIPSFKLDVEGFKRFVTSMEESMDMYDSITTEESIWSNCPLKYKDLDEIDDSIRDKYAIENYIDVEIFKKREAEFFEESIGDTEGCLEDCVEEASEEITEEAAQKGVKEWLYYLSRQYEDKVFDFGLLESLYLQAKKSPDYFNGESKYSDNDMKQFIALATNKDYLLWLSSLWNLWVSVLKEPTLKVPSKLAKGIITRTLDEMSAMVISLKIKDLLKQKEKSPETMFREIHMDTQRGHACLNIYGKKVFQNDDYTRIAKYLRLSVKELTTI